MANVTVEKDRYTVEPLYQWDKDQVLQIYGLSLASIPEIHFTNATMDKAIVRQSTVDDAGVISVDVPNSLLQKPYSITVYVCTYEDGAFKTLYSMVIPVEARNRPADYTIEVTDDEVYSFNALENKIDNVLSLSLERYNETNTKYEGATEMLAEAKEKYDQATEGIVGDFVLADGAVDTNQLADGAVETVKIADDAITAEKLAEGAINDISFFSDEMLSKYFSLPVSQVLTAGGFSDSQFDSLTTPGIYQMGSQANEHYVLIVLKPDTDYHLMQIRLSHNKVEYRSIYSDTAGEFASEDWGKWLDLTNINYIEPNDIDSADYDYKLSNIHDHIVTQIANNESWTDLPNNNSGVAFMNFRFSTNYDVQIAIQSVGGNAWHRIVNRTTGEIYRDWVSFAPDAPVYIEPNRINPADYDYKIANLHGNIFTQIANNKGWADLPGRSGVAFINFRYTTNYDIQMAIQSVYGHVWQRIVNRNTGEIYRDWTNLAGNAPVKVLAVGDSICYGGRNSKKGFVGDLGFTYKNAGLSSATISNFTTSVTNIPDQLVNVTDFTPDVIIGEGGINDYFKGVTLGALSAVPVSTDVEAEALNRSTVIGGLEYLFYKMITLYPKAQRFFLITHKTYQTASGIYCPTTENSAGWTQQDLHDAIVECCNAYNVKVIDIYNDSMMNSLFSEYRSETAYTTDNSVTDTEYVDADGVHPLAYGYKECYLPLILNALSIGTVKPNS